MDKERSIKLHRYWHKFRNGKHPGISTMPVNQQLTHYHALIKGPEGSPFTGGYFRVCVWFDDGYPFAPDQTNIWFLTPIYHPAVYYEEYEELRGSNPREICYPRVLESAGLPLDTILRNIRNDFLKKPNTFLHKPANKYALEDMFKPSRNRMDELKLKDSIEVSSYYTLEDLPDLAALVGDTEEVSNTLFREFIKEGSLNEVVSWLETEEENIKNYAEKIGVTYPQPISNAFKETLTYCTSEDSLKRARKIFVNRFLMEFFEILLYQSEWWIKASEATRKFASLENVNKTFDEWSCPS